MLALRLVLQIGITSTDVVPDIAKLTMFSAYDKCMLLGILKFAPSKLWKMKRSEVKKYAKKTHKFNYGICYGDDSCCCRACYGDRRAR